MAKRCTTTAPAWDGASWIWLQPDGKANNTHALCRKTFTLPRPPRRAVCRITANSAYELYVNGRWIGRGPVRSDPAWQYVDHYDLAGHLAADDNTLAIHAYHHGEDHVGVLTVGAGPGGLLVHLDAELPGSARSVIGTDESWRLLRAPQYAVETGFSTWHREDYKEVFDARREPVGWQLPGYDDSAWLHPVTLGPAIRDPWLRLLPNPLPPLTHTPVAPVNVFTHHSGGAYGFCKHDVITPEAMLEDNDETATVAPVEPDFEVQVLFDFGAPVVGRFHLDIADAAGGELFVSYGDSLNLTRIDQLILRPGAQQYQPYERRFGRYVMLTLRRLDAPLKIRRAWFELVAYPVEERGAFTCSDPLLNRIWEVGCRTLRLNLHDHYEDCPFREQMLYCGDLRVAALLAYHAFGDYALARESLRKLARIQRGNGVIPNHGPVASQSQNTIPEYPALWLLAVDDYHRHSGDTALVAELWPAVRKLLDWYAQWHDDTGMMRQLPTELRADFVDNLAGIPMDGPVLAVQCFYYLALTAAARLAGTAGDPETACVCTARARRLKTSVNTHFWDESRQAYRSCLSGLGEGKSRLTPDLEPEPGEPLSQISNGMALYAGITPPARRKPTLRTLLEPDRATPARSGYMNYYLTEALFGQERGAEAIRRIRAYWGDMLDRGATTFWEAFDPKAPAGRQPERLWSLCHEFCAGPVHSLPRHVLGVAPVEPGFRRTRIAPVIGDLSWARGQVPTPLGPLQIHWRLADGGGQLTLELTQPAGLTLDLELRIPGRKPQHLDVNGEAATPRLTARTARLCLPPPAHPARHRLTLRAAAASKSGSSPRQAEPG